MNAIPTISPPRPLFSAIGRLLAIVGCLILVSFAEANAQTQDTGKRWIDMDYGPYMTHSFQASQPKNNIAYKGLKIRLGDEGQAMLFDTDLLRWAAGWEKSELDWRSVVYDGSHNTHPNVKGEPVFANPVAPGWAQDGKFDDPRELPYGPLPRDWAEWKGLYLHGEDVVLSYSVGDAAILETPSLTTIDDTVLLSRALQIGKSTEDLVLQVAFDGGKKAEVVGKSVAKFVSPDGKGESTAVALAATSADVAWDVSDEHNLRLRIPAAATPLRLTIAHWQGDAQQMPAFQTLAEKLKPTADLTPLTKGGPARWDQTITTAGKLGKPDGPFAKDEITLPRDNPWKSWIRPGGFDFFADGKRAAVGTWSGDVWTVDGLGGDLSELKWRRIATGLFQPLGIRIVDDVIYVGCRDQITRLHDLNGDGETDFYESFNHDHQVTEHFHEFAMDLQTDAAGNFYYAKSARHAKTPLVPHHGTLIKVSPDGKQSEIVCNGFRAANGVGVGPHGELATSDQEGHWTPANRINLVKKGGFYGNMWSYHVGEEPTDYLPPVVWLPKNVDRSPAEQLWVPKNTWGPLAGKMIHTSYGTGWLWEVMYEDVDGVMQGGVVRLPLQFPTGIMRGRFHPESGNLYACGLVGWSSSQPVDGGFFRVRATDEPLRLPVALHVKDDGIELTFSDKLDPKTAADYNNWSIEQWNYKWTGNYGSKHYSVENPRKTGQDEVYVEEVTLSDDGKTVFIELEEVQPVMQMQIRYNIQAADGTQLKDSVWMTINKVP